MTAKSESNLDLGHARDLANEIMDKLVAMVDESGEEPAGVYFLMWIEITRALASAGWTADELVKDVQWHVKDQMLTDTGI